MKITQLLVCCVWFVFGIQEIGAHALANWTSFLTGYYNENPSNREFGINPGLYNFSARNGNECRYSCKANLASFGYAGLGANGGCFCSSSYGLYAAASSSISNRCAAATSTCMGNTTIAVYKTPPLIRGLSMVVNSTSDGGAVGRVFSNLWVATLLQAGNASYYSVDFGDGIHIGTSVNSVTYSYMDGPALMEIVSNVTDLEGNSQLFSTVVEIKLDLHSPNLTCPMYVAPATSFTCQLAVYGGYMTSEISFGDGNEAELYVGGSSSYFVGTSTAPTTYRNTTSELLYIMINKSFRYKGLLRGWRFAACGTGNVRFLVIRPYCSAPLQFCYQSRSCRLQSECAGGPLASSNTCKNGSPFSLVNRRCYTSSNGSLSQVLLWSEMPFDQLTVVGETNYTITQLGEQELKLDLNASISTLQGDMIGLEISGMDVICAASSNLSQEAALNPPANWNDRYAPGFIFTPSAATPVNDLVDHRLSAYIERPAIVNVTYAYAAAYQEISGPGKSLVINGTVSSATQNYKVSYSSVLTVQSVIINITVHGNSYVATNSSYLLDASTNPSCNASCTWIVDGINVSSSTNCSLNFTFIQAGSHVVEVIAQNQVSQKNASFTVIVEDLIKTLSFSTNTSVTELMSKSYFFASISQGTSPFFSFRVPDGAAVYNASFPPIGSASSKSIFVEELDDQSILAVYTFENVGNWSVSLNICNHVSCLWAPVPIRVLRRITSIIIETPPVLIYGRDTSLGFSIGNGSDVNVLFTIDGLTLRNLSLGAYQSAVSSGYTYAGYAVIRYHDYLTIGAHVLTLNATNALGYASASVTLWVELVIEFASIQSNVTIAEPTDAIEFSVAVFNASRVYISIYYDDGAKDTVYRDYLDMMNMSTAFTHIYKSPGNYTARLEAHNNVSSVSRNTTIIIQNPVTGAYSISSNTPIAIEDANSFGKAIVTLNITSMGVQQRPTDAHATYYFSGHSNGSVYKYIIDDTVSATYNYGSFGNYTVTVNVSNLVSSEVLTAIIVAEQRVRNLTIETSHEFIPINGSLTLSASMTWGSRVSLIWDYKDGSSTNTTAYSLGQNSSSHVCKVIGVFRPSVTAVNALGGSAAYSLKPYAVQYVVDGFTLEAVNKTPSIGAKMWTFTATFVLWLNCTTPMATNASYEVDYGDGNILTSQELSSSTMSSGCSLPGAVNQQVLSITHKYNLSKTYFVNINISNNVSKQMYSTSFHLYENILNLCIVISPFGNATTRISTTDCFTQSNVTKYFATEQNVYVFAVLDRGSDLTYCWAFAESTPCNISNNASTSNVYTDAGSYNVSVVASNLNHQEYKFQRLVVQKPVSGIQIFSQPVGPINTTILFQVNIGNNGTDACYRIDFGDETVMFGDFQQCNEIYESELVSGTGQFSQEYSQAFLLAAETSSSFVVTYNFMNSGSYIIQLTGFNKVSNETSETRILLTPKPCYIPEVNISSVNPCVTLDAASCDTTSRFANQIKIQLVSEPLRINSIVNVNCTESGTAIFNWQIFLVDTTSGAEIELNMSNVALPGQRLRQLSFAARHLPPGLYKFTLNVTMTCNTDLTAKDAVYIRVATTPLVAGIRGGSFRRIGIGNSVLLDAATLSSDPDVMQGEPQDLECIWLCRRSCEVFPVYDSSFTTVIKPFNSTCNSTEPAGCFGSIHLPPGRFSPDISFDRGNCTVNNTFGINQKGQQIVIMVVVTKDPRSASAEQVMEFVPGNPPLLETHCLSNCYDTVNLQSKLGYQVMVQNQISATQYQYRWQLSRSDGYTSSLVVLPTNYTSNYFAIYPGDIEDISSAVSVNTTFILAILVSDASSFDESTAGATYVQFKVGTPPLVGDCTVLSADGTSSSGQALLTFFNIRCKKPFQATGTGPLTYDISFSNNFLSYSTLGASQSTYQISGNQGTLLPAGLPGNNYTVSIIIRCYDEIGSWSELNMMAQVTPASNMVIDSCIFDVLSLQGPVANFYASGDTGSMLNYLGVILLTVSDYSGVWNVSAANITCTRNIKSSQGAKASYNESELAMLIDQCVSMAEVDYENHVRATENDLRQKSIAIVAGMPINDIAVATQVLSFLAVPAQVSDELSVSTLQDAVSLVQECIDVYRQVDNESTLLDSSKINMGNITVAVLDDIMQASGSRLQASTTQGNVSQLEAVQIKAVLLMDMMATFIATTVIPGDAPLIFQSSNLSIVIGKSFVADNCVSLLSSAAKIQIENVSSMFPDPQEVILITAYVHTVNPFHSASESNISNPVNSHILQFMLRGENGEKMNTTGNSTMSSTFFLNRDPSKSPTKTASGVAARADDPSAKLEVHKVFVRPGMSLQLSLDLNASTSAQGGSAAVAEQHSQTTPATAVSETTVASTSLAASTSPSQISAGPFGTWRVYIKNGSPPTITNYDTICELPIVSTGGNGDGDASEQKNSSCMITGNAGVEGATYYIAVTYSPSRGSNSTNQTSTARRKRSVALTNSTTDTGATNPSYGASMQSAQCSFWDYSTNSYTSDGCEVGGMSVPTSAQCVCNRLPFSVPNITSGGELQAASANPPVTIGSLFEVPINTIDFSKLTFDNLNDNPTVFSVTLSIVCIYLCTLVWARKQDSLDEVKALSSPLLDNDPRDRYLYELTIYTGGRSRAGTTAKVSMILSGEEDETPPRLIYDDKRPVLKRGSIDSFIMAVPRSLGSLTMMRVWHDNSGQSPSWYFSRMQVCNMQTQEKYFFVANHWLAVDEEDSVIDRIIPVAGKAELTNFSHLFWVKSKRDLMDGHLWFSVFGRPAMSRFTRVQRLTCCLSLLFSTMAVNILFYDAESNSSDASDNLFELGSVHITRKHLLTGIYSSFLVFPVNLVVVMIFRKSAVRRSKVLRALSTAIAQSTTSNLGFNEHLDGDRQQAARKAKKKKIYFPWWCIFVAYFLCIGTVVFGILLTTAIAIEFGEQRSTGWLISFITSFLESLFFTQPVKVLGMALFFALVIKRPAAEGDTGDRHLGLRDDEVYYQTSQTTKNYSRSAGFEQLDRYKNIPQPPPPEYLKAAQNLRQKNMAMQEIIRDIVTYLLFLFVLLFVCYGSNSPSTFFQQSSLKAVYRNGYYSDRLYQQTFGLAKVSMTKVIAAVDFWTWIHVTFLPGLYAGQYLTNPILPFFHAIKNHQKVNSQLYHKMAGQWFNLTVDGNTVLVGAPRLRQLRMGLQAPCRESAVKILRSCCLDGYSEDGEDRGAYLSAWSPLPINSTVPQGPDPWTYSTSQQLEGLPIIGHQAIYGGGGFVAELGTDLTRSMDILARLQANNWVDNRTRAVIVEFSLFNANLNLNAAMTLLFEVLPTGDILPFFHVYIFTLDQYTNPGMLTILVTAAECVASLFVIYFIIREIKQSLKGKLRYFKNPWNLYELLVAGMCVAVIVVYINRWVEARSVMTAYRADKTRYLNVAKVAMWDEAFVYMLAVIVFASTLKMTKMLRFNHRIMTLIRTLSALGLPMLSFFGVMLVAFMAFASASYVLYSSNVLSFTTFLRTCETLFVMILNKFNYSNLTNKNPVLGPLFFIAFVIFINFMMVNFMTTLIMSKFSEVKDKARKARNYYELVDFMMSKMKAFLGIANGPSLPRLQSEASSFVSDPDDGAERVFDDLMGRILMEVSNDLEQKELLEAADKNIREGKADNLINLMSRKRLYLA